MFEIAFWDFDGTLIPFDSEQFLLESLFVGRGARRSVRALAARLFVFADRHGWDPGLLKVLYGWCLRGVPLAALDPICAEIVTRLATAERSALRSLAQRGLKMVLLSCGTADLSRRVLHLAGLGCFQKIEANRLLIYRGEPGQREYIAGIERRVHRPETKVGIAAGYGVPWERVVAVGDGLTDVPLLDRAGLAVLIAGGEKAGHFAGRGYCVVPSLSQAVALVASRLDRGDESMSG